MLGAARPAQPLLHTAACSVSCWAAGGTVRSWQAAAWVDKTGVLLYPVPMQQRCMGAASPVASLQLGSATHMFPYSAAPQRSCVAKSSSRNSSSKSGGGSGGDGGSGKNDGSGGASAHKPGPSGQAAAHFNGFTREVLAAAHLSAKSMGCSQVMPGHMLLGCLQLGAASKSTSSGGGTAGAQAARDPCCKALHAVLLPALGLSLKELQQGLGEVYAAGPPADEEGPSASASGDAEPEAEDNPPTKAKAAKGAAAATAAPGAASPNRASPPAPSEDRQGAPVDARTRAFILRAVELARERRALVQPCHLLAAMVEEEEESSPWGNALSWAVNTYAEDPEAAARQALAAIRLHQP